MANPFLETTVAAIRWKHAVDSRFDHSGRWKGAVVPGVADDAIVKAIGPAFTVTAVKDETVKSIQTGANATLVVAGNPSQRIVFSATDGTGSGRNAGSIIVGENSTLLIGGEMRNTGAIDLRYMRFPSVLEIATSGATLSGGGQVNLSIHHRTGSQNFIYGSTPTATLINIDNTISGSGFLGAGKMNLVNEDRGVIDANGAYGLAIRTTDMITNAGTIEATNGSRMSLQSSVNNTGGLIRASERATLEFDDAGVTFGGVVLASSDATILIAGGTISGATLSTTNAGVIETNGSAEFDGATAAVRNTGRLLVGGIVALRLKGSIVNSGEIDLNGKYLNSVKSIALDNTNVTLSGGGAVNLGNTGQNMVMGETPMDTLVNVDNTIAGSGHLGDGQMGLVNESAGVIVADKAASLLIDTGGGAIVNAGAIEATGVGVAVVAGAISNTGVLAVDGGALTVEGDVSGAGSADIGGGVLSFGSAFAENVAFTGGRGTLSLTQSQTYSGTVSGFAVDGSSLLDLRDIAFTGADEASYSGTTSGGVLTLSDGTHTANITLAGDFLGTTFVGSSDGHGGTDIIAQNTKGGPAEVDAFVSAIAGFGAPSGQAVHFHEALTARAYTLIAPRAAMA